MLDDYLKDSKMTVFHKRVLLSAFFTTSRSRKKVYVLLDNCPLLCVSHTQAVTPLEHTAIASVKLFDGSVVHPNDLHHTMKLFKSCKQLALMKRGGGKRIFYFFMSNLLHRWRCLYPFSDWRQMIQDSHAMQDLSIEELKTTKDSIYKMHCLVCSRQAEQMCHICSVYYCSARCQKDDWQKHKISCFTYDFEL